MAYVSHPPSLYDEIIEDRDYCKVNGTTIPIREGVIDEVGEYAGQKEVQIERPDGTTHTLTGDEPVPERDELLNDLLAAQRGFSGTPISTLGGMPAVSIAPLHYTNTTAHYTVTDEIFDASVDGSAEPVPSGFKSLGVKTAHLHEGFKIADNLPHHWIDDLGWLIPRHEVFRTLDLWDEEGENNGVTAIPHPPQDDCFIINVPIAFPAQGFGQTTDAPAKITNSAIKHTERTLSNTLLTKRMAQLDAVKTRYEILKHEMERGSIDQRELDDIDTVVQETFGISASGLASLKSQTKERKRKAFQTVRRLSDSDDFNMVMEEFAETVDELGRLAYLGTKYREEVMGESPGFY